MYGNYNDNMSISSNNSINENKYNNEKLMKSSAAYKIKKILKPIVQLLKNKKALKQQEKNRQSKYISYSSSNICDDYWINDESYDNSANEKLEAQIMDEVQQSHENAAIFVFNDNAMEIMPVHQEEFYVPVHFARTAAGTFFWTAISREADCDLVQPTSCYSDYQVPQQAYADRWAQA